MQVMWCVHNSFAAGPGPIVPWAGAIGLGGKRFAALRPGAPPDNGGVPRAEPRPAAHDG